MTDSACSAAFAGLAPEHDPIHEDPAVRQAARERLRWAIDCAAAAGGDVVQPAALRLQGLPRPRPHRRRVRRRRAPPGRRARAAVRRPAGARGAQPLRVLPAQHREPDARAGQRVDHPNLKAHYDTHHMHQRSATQALPSRTPRRCSPRALQRERPRRSGQGPGRLAGHVLSAARLGLRRLVRHQAFSRLDPEFAAGIHVWRDYFAAPEDVCRGAAFVKQGLA